MNTYFDANALIFLTKAGFYSGKGRAILDSLISSGDDLIITSTVRAEVSRNLTFEQNNLFQSWVNVHANNGIEEIRTYRGGKSAGELSVVDAYNILSDTDEDNLIITRPC